MNEKLQEYLVNGIDATVAYAPKIVLGLVLLIVGWKVAGWVAKGLRTVLTKREVDPSLIPFLGIGYGDDIDKTREVINDLIAKEGRILPDPAPQVVVAELADSSVNFKVRVWTATGDYWGGELRHARSSEEALRRRGHLDPLSATGRPPAQGGGLKDRLADCIRPRSPYLLAP